MVFYYNAFDGGYSVDLPHDKYEKEMLSTAQNVYWDGRLRERSGVSDYATTDVGADKYNGMCRAYLNSTWYTIVARETSSGDVNFYYGLTDDGTLTEIDNTFDWASGTVEMKQFGSYVVAVNGVDKPAVIYYDSSMTVENLETLDTRTREDDDWYAGQYDDGESTYADDTDNAQTASVDFQYAGTATGDGCFVAGVFTFNKITFGDVTPLGGTGDVTYEYYKGSTWGTMDLTATPDWNPGATADIDVEFNYPSDWEIYDGTEDILNGRYVIRITFGDPPAAAKECGELTVYHTQYLTQIMGDERPQAVEVHMSRLYLAANNSVNYSPPEQITGWTAYDLEIFREGGPKVLAMRSMPDYLAVIKSSAIYGYFGNIWQNREVRLLNANVGALSARSCAVVNNTLFFLSRDGIRVHMGEMTKVVSKHIKTDVSSYTGTNACAVNYEGKLLMAFPSNDVVLWADPDTYRQDELGDGRLSFYKFTGIEANQMSYHYDDADNGYLLAIKNSTPTIQRIFDGNYQDGTVDITTKVKTRPISGGVPLQKKHYTRAKIETNSGIGFFTFRLYGEYDRVEAEGTMDSGTATGHYNDYFGIPYTIDGNTIAMEIECTASVEVEVYGFALEAGKRRY